MGYRWYDTKKIKPLYPFGYGLSYSTWSLTNMSVNKASYGKKETLSVSVKLNNTGAYDGKQTVQVYIAKAASTVDRAEKELKGFKKVLVPAGRSANVTIDIPVSDLAYFDTASGKWKVESGFYMIEVGTSSREILAARTIRVNAD